MKLIATAVWSQLIQQAGVELALAEPGNDNGLLPINSLLLQLGDRVAQDDPPHPLAQVITEAIKRLNQIFDSTAKFDESSVAWLRGWRTWMSSAVENWRDEKALPPWPSPFNESVNNMIQPGAEPALAAASVSGVILTSTRGDSVPPDPAITLQISTDADLLREFVSESQEHLENIERGVLVLEESPTDADTLNSIFRAFHTFKGGSGFLNLSPIQDLAHELESLLDAARQGRLSITNEIIDLILAGGDTLKQFIAEIDAQVAGRAPDRPIVIPTRHLIYRVRTTLDEECSHRKNVRASEASLAPPSAAKHTEPTKPQDTTASLPSASKTEASNGSPSQASVKVDTHKLDALIDMVGELVIAQSMVAQDPNVLRVQSQQLSRNLTQLGRITNELQRATMALRMVPVRGTFQKMARLVRDLSAKQAKKVRLLLSGEGTELDRNLVEVISDPLIHMIRNAVDHGVETPAARTRQSKPAEGTIHLRAFHQGGSVVVQIEDDGAGLSKERILAKAVKRGLIRPEASLPDEEIYRLIFQAGFSTSEVITDVSGRGVGLDVVLRNVEKLRGKVEIDSTPGQGTRFTMQLPLTLAIIDGLVIRAGAERYILPTLSVRESFRPTREMLSTVQERGEVVNVRGRLTPVLRLYEHFDVKPKTTDPAQAIFVVVESGDQTRCLMVDELVGKQEVVIKSLCESLGHHRALAGAAILGDGRVGLILDIDFLVKLNALPMSLAA